MIIDALAGGGKAPVGSLIVAGLLAAIMLTVCSLAAAYLIFLPVAMQYGMDPVQFGMVMLISRALGLNTLPVGIVQFIGCAIGSVSVGEVIRPILPVYGALLAALFLVTDVPAFSLWLPWLLRP